MDEIPHLIWPVFNFQDQSKTTKNNKRVAVLVSGRGSNLQALVKASQQSDFPAEIVCVISDNPKSQGAAWAQEHGIPTNIIPREVYRCKSDHEAAIDYWLKNQNIDIVCLAGYMRIMSAEFCEDWQGRLLNIHPSLLPAFKGLNTHQRALDQGTQLTGCSVHHVSPALDSGPTIIQAATIVKHNDTAEQLAERVLQLEHIIYPQALHALCIGLVSQ